MINNKEIEEYLQGNSLTGYNSFGAHFTFEYNQNGIRFTVYAPNAKKVQLVGTFNNWSGYDMDYLPCGVWTLFINNAHEFDLYKYRIITNQGETIDKADPFSFYNEKRPNTASIIYNINNYNWSDESFLENRTKNFNSPLNIYEVHVSSWKIKDADNNSFYNYKELASMLIPYAKEMGYTHIELLPITEYPFDGSWGYQTSGYYSPTSRYGTPKDFMYFVNECHNNNIGVILDVVPGHHVKDMHALYNFDGNYLYENNDINKRFTEWDTALFDFTKPHVLSFVKSSLDFWISYYHIDGLRYDSVSTLIYTDGDLNKGINDPGLWFLKNTNFNLQNKYKSVMIIAEDSSIYPKVTAPVPYGGIGFDYKWNFGWMHDTLEYFELSPGDREFWRSKLTFSIEYFYSEIFLLPISHDEVSHFKKSVINRMYGDYDEKFSNLRCFYLLMFTHPGKKLNFMGSEFGQFDAWYDNQEIDWAILEYPKHAIFKNYLCTLHNIYINESSLFRNDYNMQSFSWLNTHDNLNCIFAYKRDDLESNKTYIVHNLSDKAYSNYCLEVDEPGVYKELINSNDKIFDGDGRINGNLNTMSINNKYYLNLFLTPYTSIIFKIKN